MRPTLIGCRPVSGRRPATSYRLAARSVNRWRHERPSPLNQRQQTRRHVLIHEVQKVVVALVLGADLAKLTEQ